MKVKKNQVKQNYHKLMLEQIQQIDSSKEKKRLLLHSCCAPCSSYVLQCLCQTFDIEVLFFNPNIYPQEEYERRIREQIRLVKEMKLGYNVIGMPYDSHLFYEAIKGYENMGEGSERCYKCFKLRLEKAAQYAQENQFDFFTTTLTISPMKNAEMLNEIGVELGKKYGVSFLHSDFKKNNGYKCSIELSKKYNLYRQNYCGCVFSQKEAKERMLQKAK